MDEAPIIQITTREEMQRLLKPTLEVFLGRGISENPRDWSIGDAVLLLQEVGKEGPASLTPDMIKNVRSNGYDWIETFRGHSLYENAVLRMEAYARLNDTRTP